MQLSLGLSFVALAYAAVVGAQRGGTTCGDTDYSATDVDRASTAACQYVRDGGRAGGSTYPHEYRNFEGFAFRGLEGPFYEFPILSSKRVYSGGRPGPDRVIVTEDCQQAGQLTHTGASGNNFVGCSGTN
ncbi:Guanyl-specific ribonuclease F1 [Hirsutella minnesotensis 3608]|uniref:ribonuclease T1 n=1 Tax=Hirsutella minnesotensis 3608 TaxID=1043627 RepID=A0A0F7ZQH7_9HYPO|nr:Guanyl-specific ribonuclease F1 [Hirsutella minnesotensis 3608]